MKIKLNDNDDWKIGQGRRPGCQSTNHTQCYGPLWQCGGCRKKYCQCEGHADDGYFELCDDCWEKKLGKS